jgi:hypothetical protein
MKMQEAGSDFSYGLLVVCSGLEFSVEYQLL